MEISVKDARIVQWTEGKVLPAPRQLIVAGSNQNVRSDFQTYLCLYPSYRRKVRMFGPLVDAAGARRKLQECILPRGTASAYRQFKQRSYPSIDDDGIWRMGLAQTRAMDMPIAVFAVGETMKRGQERQILYVCNLLPPDQTLKAFKRAVRWRGVA